jgi:hypothetical protein
MLLNLNAFALFASSVVVQFVSAAFVPQNATAEQEQELDVRQARAAVITKCTVPGTVALTFVRLVDMYRPPKI